MTSKRTLDALASEMLSAWPYGDLPGSTAASIADLSTDEAYGVQEKVIAARVAAGERHAGYKVGCTSAAVRTQFGLHEPVFGHLLWPHLHKCGAILPASVPVSAVEPEYAFRVKRRLAGHDVSTDDVAGALSGPYPGIELHHYRFFYERPTAPELIASNALHAALVYVPAGGPGPALSPEVPGVPHEVPVPTPAELAEEEIELLINDITVDRGVGGEIFGAGPLDSVAWLVGQLARRGRALEPGEVVIPGSAVALHRVSPGDRVEARFGRFGQCSARFGPARALGPM
jgi:2-keto-4-pentenoate hydratase